MITNNNCQNKEDVFSGEEFPQNDLPLDVSLISFVIAGKHTCYEKEQFINYVQANRPLVFNLKNLKDPATQIPFGEQILENSRLPPTEITQQLGYNSTTGDKIPDNEWNPPEGAMVERDLNDERNLPIAFSDDDFVSVEESAELDNIHDAWNSPNDSLDEETREQMIRNGLDPNRTVVENTPESQINASPLPLNRFLFSEAPQPTQITAYTPPGTPPQTPRTAYTPPDTPLPRSVRRRTQGGKPKKTSRKKKSKSKRKIKTRKNRTKKNRKQKNTKKKK